MPIIPVYINAGYYRVDHNYIWEFPGLNISMNEKVFLFVNISFILN